MLSKTPGQIGKEIQIVTGIDLADEIKTGLNLEINDLKKDILRLENSIDEDQKELSEYPDLKQIKKNINRYESVVEKRKKQKSKLFEVEKLSGKYNELKQSICLSKEKIRHLESIKDKIERCENELIKIREEKRRKQDIIKLIEKAERMKQNIDKVKINIERMKSQYKKQLGDICPTCGNDIDNEKIERIL